MNRKNADCNRFKSIQFALFFEKVENFISKDIFLHYCICPVSYMIIHVYTRFIRSTTTYYIVIYVHIKYVNVGERR